MTVYEGTHYRYISLKGDSVTSAEHKSQLWHDLKNVCANKCCSVGASYTLTFCRGTWDTSSM